MVRRGIAMATNIMRANRDGCMITETDNAKVEPPTMPPIARAQYLHLPQGSAVAKADKTHTARNDLSLKCPDDVRLVIIKERNVDKCTPKT